MKPGEDGEVGGGGAGGGGPSGGGRGGPSPGRRLLAPAPCPGRHPSSDKHNFD